MSTDTRSALERTVNLLRGVVEELEPGQQLPPRKALADRAGSAQSTVQTAVRLLEEEGLIETRGRGARPVVAQPRELPTPETAGPAEDLLDSLLADALGQAEAAIDYYGFTSETLVGSLVPLLDRLRVARTRVPRRLAIRLLLTNPQAKLDLPSLVADADDPRPRQRLQRLMQEQLLRLRLSLDPLRRDYPDHEFSLTVRTTRHTPTHKLYLINRRALEGYYDVLTSEVQLPFGSGSRAEEIYDIVGVDAELWQVDYRRAERWFASRWSGPTEEYTLVR